MDKPLETGTKYRVLALLWHAPHQVIAAGGFRRTYEIFSRAPRRAEILAIDNSPTFLCGISGDNVTVREYRIPRFVLALETRFFWFERVLEWLLATIIMTAECGRMRARGEKFEVVFVPNSEQVPALLAGIVSKYFFGARMVACNLNIDIFPARVRRPIARLHNHADVVIAISKHLAGGLLGYGVHAPMVINGVGLDTGVISSAPDPAAKEYDAVFVGRHDAEKGVFDLIEIWKSVTGKYPSAKLAMIGSCNPNNRAKLVSLISELGLEGNVYMKGTVDDDTKYSLIKGSKLCLFPSYVEEWGIVPQEALACGLPVVAYDLPVYRENIKPCEAVFLEPVGDITGMARKAVELLSDEEYQKYELLGPEFVSQFGWDEVAEREFRILLEPGNND
jgi:glycosyltransferase involved in cell wall biosynthesis